MIKSKEIDKYIHELLIKPYTIELNEEDLKKVKRIVLSKYNIKNEIVEYDYSDLSKLTNLEKCSIEFLDITDELINNLNQLENLKTIEINSCKIKSVDIIKNNIEKIMLQKVDNHFFTIFDTLNVETIEIIDFKEIDLAMLSQYVYLKNLYIYNSNIINFKQVLQMKSIETLKLDGSKIDDEEVLEKISKNVAVQRKDEFLLANAN